jgi:hypothetical protein
MALTKVSAGVLNIDDLYGFRNRIINGDMRIDQRNAGASVTNTGATTFYLDRWNVLGTTSAGQFSIQQVTDAPAGFVNSAKMTVTTVDASLAASDRYVWMQRIEGYSVSDFGFGTANAKTVTVSFWVKSSLTGTFSGSLGSAAGGVVRIYLFNYTISAADTWEYKTVTIAGDTIGTWTSDNSRAMQLSFSLGAGSDYVGTVNTWGSGNLYATSGAVNVLATAGATWQITGVQLEAGSTATPFERRPFGTELALCQRYFFRVAAGADSFTQFAMGRAFSGTAGNGVVQFPVPMRSKPTFAFLGVVGNYDFNPTAISGGAVPASNTHMTVGMDFSSISSGSIFVLGQNSSSTPCGFTFSSEL